MMYAITFFHFLILLSLCSVAQSYGDYEVLIDVSGNGFAHNSVIYFDDESWDPLNPPSYGWDACCDAMLIMGNQNQPHIYTEVVDLPAPPNTDRLTINGLPLLSESIDVPLGFLPGQLAEYTFTFSQLNTIPLGVTVELEDLGLNITQDLLLDNTYTTWGAVSDEEERFLIRFNPSSITTSGPRAERDPRISVRRFGSELEITFKTAPVEGKIKIYDTLGSEKEAVSTEGQTKTYHLSTEQLSSGFYIIQYRGVDGKDVHKRIII